MTKVLIVATSRKTRGGITSVIKAYETGEQWKKYHCTWIQTHRDGPAWRKIWYLFTSLTEYMCLLPFCDIVHIHTADGASATRKRFFAKLCKLANKKLIVHVHLGDENKLFNNERNGHLLDLLRMADRLIVLSPMWKRWVVKALPETESRIEVLWNPCPTVIRTGCERKKVILFAGTIVKRKGYDMLLNAFNKVADKYPDWRVEFAGNPYLREGINELEDGKRIASELGITDRVDWLGWVSGEAKERLFNEAAIYVLPSTSEGFPMGVLDAWAYGVPCVMTPVGGIPDIVEDGKEGLIFPVGDVDAFAQALEKLMVSEELRSEIVENADALVKRNFDVKAITKQLGEIYSKLLI